MKQIKKCVNCGTKNETPDDFFFASEKRMCGACVVEVVGDDSVDIDDDYF